MGCCAAAAIVIIIAPARSTPLRKIEYMDVLLYWTVSVTVTECESVAEVPVTVTL